jgi:predicted  nucleic acid-binding Zn-ribbon protein
LNKERQLFEDKISDLIVEKEAKENAIKELQNSFKRMSQQLNDESERVLRIKIEHAETGRYVSASDYRGVPVPDHLYKTKIKNKPEG